MCDAERFTLGHTCLSAKHERNHLPLSWGCGCVISGEEPLAPLLSEEIFSKRVQHLLWEVVPPGVLTTPVVNFMACSMISSADLHKPPSPTD